MVNQIWNEVQLGPVIGSEVTGIDLNRLDDELAEKLRDRLAERQVLVIRDQKLDRSTHKAVARLFGTGELHRHALGKARGTDDAEVLHVKTTAESKFTAGEGGLHVPLIIAGPNVAQQRVNARAFVTDITPTLLERAGVPADAPAMDGYSLSTLLADQTPDARGPLIPIGVEVSGHSALYRGDYKLVRTPPPLGDSGWRLYNITVDPGETTDLAAQQPDLVSSMLADYQAYAQRNGVLELPPGYDPQAQVVHNTRMKTYQRYWWIFAGIGVIGLLLLGGVIWLVRRLIRRRTA